MGGFGRDVGGRTDAGPNRTTAAKFGVGTINESGRVVSEGGGGSNTFIKRRAEKSNSQIKGLPISGAKFIGSIFKKGLAEGAKKRGQFFQNDVIGKKGGIYEDISRIEFQNMSEAEQEKMYAGYVEDTRSGKRDPFGRDIIGGSGDGVASTKKLQGIELAKASTTSATILGPAEIQKQATNNNNISGPTTTEMSADQITLANKRKGRKTTNMTAKKTLANNYTLSKKTLLG